MIKSVGIRQISEENEFKIMHEKAIKSSQSLGRQVQEEKCNVRTEFQRDRDRILHSKAFRRLKHKTQVFLSPEGDHFRTRLTHTLEVSQIARTIARALRLNEDLTEAIALGHDLGHTPFGHKGEVILNELHKEYGGFKHNEHSLRVVDILEERSGGRKGLNLTEEVRDGILNHSGKSIPFTLEGQIVRVSDRIAYINHDIDDSIRAKILKFRDIPGEYINEIGSTHSSRIDTLINNIIENSMDLESIRFSKDMDKRFSALRTFMFEKVYYNPGAKSEEEKAANMLKALYKYFDRHPEKMPNDEYTEYIETGTPSAIKDYIAGMCDRYAISKFEEIFVPVFWK